MYNILWEWMRLHTEIAKVWREPEKKGLVTILVMLLVITEKLVCDTKCKGVEKWGEEQGY